MSQEKGAVVITTCSDTQPDFHKIAEKLANGSGKYKNVNPQELQNSIRAIEKNLKAKHLKSEQCTDSTFEFSKEEFMNLLPNTKTIPPKKDFKGIVS